jgi:Flp pilus assembly protein TadG
VFCLPNLPYSLRHKACFTAWRQDSRGTAAIEFGLIGVIFVLFICVFLELGLTLFMQTTLDRAVRKEARLIRIGSITISQQSTFLANICSDMLGLVNCSALQLNVASGSSFASLTSANSLNSQNQMANVGFNPGGSASDVIVQVGYSRPAFTPIAAQVFGKNGQVFIRSSIAFQNEPF